MREEGLDGPGSSSFQKLVRELEMQKDKAGQVDGKWEVGLSVEGEREKCARKEGKNRSVRKAAPPQAQRVTGSARAGDRQEKQLSRGRGRGGRGPRTTHLFLQMSRRRSTTRPVMRVRQIQTMVRVS